MSTHTERCFSRKSSGRYGHGIRLNQVNFMRASARRTRVSTVDVTTLTTLTATASPSSLAAPSMNELFYLGSSFWLGALHAATPGHGKTIAAAYIVGARGRPVDALVLGIFVTLSHTSGIVLVAVLATLGSAWLLPQRVEAYVAVVTGLLVIGMGVWLLWTQSPGLRMESRGHHSDHEHGRDGAASSCRRSRLPPAWLGRGSHPRCGLRVRTPSEPRHPARTRRRRGLAPRPGRPGHPVGGAGERQGDARSLHRPRV